jgi:hypothetical protein
LWILSCIETKLEHIHLGEQLNEAFHLGLRAQRPGSAGNGTSVQVQLNETHACTACSVASLNADQDMSQKPCE